MSLSDSRPPSPHFPLPGAQTAELASLRNPIPLALPALLMRAADCLVAALQNPTTEAGLNESRFRVLAALHAQAAEECSQAELAGLLLQSESNLSTLLERMSVDGLIARRRSEVDRRRSLIRLTADGRHAWSAPYACELRPSHNS